MSVLGPHSQPVFESACFFSLPLFKGAGMQTLPLANGQKRKVQSRRRSPEPFASQYVPKPFNPLLPTLHLKAKTVLGDMALPLPVIGCLE